MGVKVGINGFGRIGRLVCRIAMGVDDIDRKLIFIAIQNGEKLTIDRYGHVYDSSKRWIADAMKR